MYKHIIGTFFLLSLFQPCAIAKELRVAVASNFHHALTLLSRQFEQETGIKVKLSSGASGLLYAQVVRGAPFDLFFSADVERPELLESQGLTTNRNTYVYGRIALWSPQSKAIVGQSFLTNFDQRLAIANPRLAPYGKAAEQTLAYLKLSTKFNSTLILGNNINQTFQFVDSGNVLAGFVAYSLLKNQSINNNYWLVPQTFHGPIAQQVVLLKASKHKKSAQALLEFILSASTQTKLQTMGYSSVNKAIALGDI